MAKVISNLVIDGTSGRLGRQLYLRRVPGGQTILCHRPNFSGRVSSEAQMANQLRFRKAAAYAQDAARREPLYARLAAGTIRGAYHLALADWLNPPEIHRIEIRDGLIAVCATDKIHLAGVRVTLCDAGGAVLEEGEAVQIDSLWWHYTPSAPLQPDLRVQVEARDLPGNRARLDRGI